MNRKHLYILIDTETAGTIDRPTCYNIAWKVIDRMGNVYAEGNYINRDVFFGMADLMASAYYANKIPEYLEQIERGEIKVASWGEIVRAFRSTCELFNVKAVIAHNARFDYRSCSNTQRLLSDFPYFFPKDVEIWDTLRMARDVLNQMPTYCKWCEENGFCKKNGEPRHTAEVIYRYITRDTDFVEEHKAMEDVNIECEIFWYLTRQHKKMHRKCFD